MKGVVPLKTTVEEVIVEVTVNGRKRRLVFPIKNKDGELMTHRLKRLMRGRFSSGNNGGQDVEFHFVGMVWRPPYTLLRELYEENCALRNELMGMDGSGHLVVAEPPAIPKHVPHDAVTQMIQKELKLYDGLRRRIKDHGMRP